MSLRLFSTACWALILACTPLSAAHSLPLPEHPRPDFERKHWQNLNGTWEFKFDKENLGLDGSWSNGENFDRTIMVPFPWGSALSTLPDEAPIGWYAREISAPEDWKDRSVFVVIGASDWETRAWLDGKPLGRHQGGYTPFEFELTPHLKPGQKHRLVLRVDDTARAFKLEGKQGYGNARGIWQTIYLEARPKTYIRTLHFLPDIDNGNVTVKAVLSAPVPKGATLRLKFQTGDVPGMRQALDAGSTEVEFQVQIPNARLWSLEDPFLYEVEAILGADNSQDSVSSYFGMRKISVVDLPGLGHPYISLNNKPIYLQITLDQSYHPEGFYTFPSDAFMRDEILRSRRIGLNANRFHVKVEVPRKLYWADKLGLLVMADVPNSWGEPTAEMRKDLEYAFREMVARDFNHPSIFAWVPFNETWGLFSGKGSERKYLPETQEWVASMYRLGKQLDPTRLVEDNSPCNYDHVATDINSWHVYLPGYEWSNHLDQVTRDTFDGSKWNFIGGRSQQRQPLLNSECGNVWGYEGSSGDCDWSWDYHIMMNEFRRHPKICGWLYTEHHDVINEWNGYYRFDRSEKFTGLEELVTGMTLRDLHAVFYLSTGSELCRDVTPGQNVTVPLWASFMTDQAPVGPLRLRAMLTGWDTLGNWRWFSSQERAVEFRPWLSKELDPLDVNMPDEPGLLLLSLVLEDQTGRVLHRNFTTFLSKESQSARDEELQRGETRLRVLRFDPASFSSAHWSIKQWDVLDGLKVNGAGAGFFEYRVKWPEGLDVQTVDGATLVFEASAKKLLGKDKEGVTAQEGDFMLGKGTHDPSLNRNAYPMTDTVRFPSAVQVRVDGESLGIFDLPDDPADHRGILSWHFQQRDRYLREAGSYGYLVQAAIPQRLLRTAAKDGELVIRFEVDDGLLGGLAIYGERFGRYPMDPTIAIKLR